MEGELLLMEVIACGRCGTRSRAGAQFCHACGQSLTSNGQVVVPPGQPNGAPPAGYNAGSPSGTGAARPIGIVILAIVEIVIGLVGLTVVVDLLYWANYSSYYHEAEAGLDLAMGLAYLATSVAGFVLAWGLWSMRPWAWMPTCLLSVVLIGFDVFSVFEWGLTGLDLIGVTVHLAVLSYLNMNSVRGLFGRSPTTFLQGAR